MQFTISARAKPAAQHIQQLIKQHFSDIPVGQIDSFFGFTEACTLYGGRVFRNTELSAYSGEREHLFRTNVNT